MWSRRASAGTRPEPGRTEDGMAGEGSVGEGIGLARSTAAQFLEGGWVPHIMEGLHHGVRVFGGLLYDQYA
ncbi:hypothetical protein Esi_0338_0016 [Ectocarpus siliculosus]|uniref:Uncharacterized protein n=1 Tax=Ectocarpus siliculosus TaxID=2880 RepID=D7FY18_ECTSI|nr:hypothetical protein Esi_0338_0016 [Ectocarpus siliculosus]|eukprot:CBJ32431.1 hypothetical protein Esi_0338_0016 [Ectocarpus siliculosus]